MNKIRGGASSDHFEGKNLKILDLGLSGIKSKENNL